MERWPLGKGSSRREVAVVESWLLQGGSSCKEEAVVKRWPFVKRWTLLRWSL